MPYRLPSHLEQYAEAIPGDIRKALSDAELLARCTEAHRIRERARGLPLSPIDYRAWLNRVAAVLKATPPRELKAQLDELRAKATAASGRSRGHGSNGHRKERSVAADDHSGPVFPVPLLHS